MKIIIDECLPKRVVLFFEDHEAWTVPQIGLNGAKDGELLDELDKRSIGLFVTIDGSIEYQQTFMGRTFGTIVIRSVSNRFEDLLSIKEELISVISRVKAGNVYHVPEH